MKCTNCNACGNTTCTVGNLNCPFCNGRGTAMLSGCELCGGNHPTGACIGRINAE